MAAGDACVFSTNLYHDAAAWTEEYPRLNVFQRFTLSAYFGAWACGGFLPPPMCFRSWDADAQAAAPPLTHTVAAFVGEFGPGNHGHHGRLGANCAELEAGSYGDAEPAAVVEMRKWWAAKEGRPMSPHRRHIKHCFPKL